MVCSHSVAVRSRRDCKGHRVSVSEPGREDGGRRVLGRAGGCKLWGAGTAGSGGGTRVPVARGCGDQGPSFGADRGRENHLRRGLGWCQLRGSQDQRRARREQRERTGLGGGPRSRAGWDARAPRPGLPGASPGVSADLR